MLKFGVGQPVKRYEDPVLVSGRGTYTDDLRIPGALHAAIVRSPYAHAAIKGFDTAAARAMPGVVAVFTGADVAAAKLGLMECKIPMKNRDGTPRADTRRPILQDERVRHVGDPVAVVVAATLAEARDAAEAVVVDYEELPHVVDTAAATRPGAPRAWDHIKDNIAFDWEKGDLAAVDAALAKAAHVVRVTLVNNRVVANSMETRTAIGEVDAATGKVTLTTSCQGTQGIRAQVAAILGIPAARMRVKCPHVGGGFGMKVFLHPEQALLPWLALKLGRTVRWTSERAEAFLTDVQGRDHVSVAELALDKDARFLALKVVTTANEGAYLSGYAPYVATGGSDMHVGLYRTPAIYTRVIGVVTNTVPVDAYRGAGRPEAAYLVERVVDAAARQLRLAPDEIRRRNFIPASAMPYKTPLGDVFDSGEFETVMDKAMKRADWAGFRARKLAALKRGKLRGIGLATYIERCGGGGPETAILKFEPDATVSVVIGNIDNGQGHTTSYKQVMATALGIDPQRVKLVQGDSDLVPDGMTGGSRALSVGGAAILGAAEEVKKKGREIAARLLEVSGVDVEYAEGRFRVVGTDRTVSIWDVAEEARKGGGDGLDSSHERKPEAATFPNGCHVAEVEIDSETGTVSIPRYTVVDDFGATINPLTLAGQVHGGIVQGLGQALTERTVYDSESGQLVSGSFMDYALPKADDMPSFAFELHNVRCTTNPLGVKGSGEAGAIGSCPAVINALVDALAPFGVTHIDMPATPHAIWAIVHRAPAKAA
jgi:aerobic carbon-monoxide dehydrogenase large subunit